jgi:hypothetical protein
MFPNSNRAAGQRYLAQLIEMGPPPYYFSYRRKQVPCQILEIYGSQVRVGFRDAQGRPKEIWEDTKDVVTATRLVHSRNQAAPSA